MENIFVIQIPASERFLVRMKYLILKTEVLIPDEISKPSLLVSPCFLRASISLNSCSLFSKSLWLYKSSCNININTFCQDFHHDAVDLIVLLTFPGFLTLKCTSYPETYDLRKEPIQKNRRSAVHLFYLSCSKISDSLVVLNPTFSFCLSFMSSSVSTNGGSVGKLNWTDLTGLAGD